MQSGVLFVHLDTLDQSLAPDKVTNDMRDAAIQAEVMKQFQATQPQPQQGSPVAGADAGDVTGAGGGNIGTGAAPTPGEQGFSGNAGQANPQPPQASGGGQPNVASNQ